MKIVFNKVTWYSKLAAVFVLFIFVPTISFYLGSYYEQTKILIKNTPPITPFQNIEKTKPILLTPKTNKMTPDQSIKKEPTRIACSMIAKLCPDGSYVARTGPNCDFTPCPKK